MGDTLLYGTFPFRKWSPFLIFFRTTCTCRKGKKVRLCLVDSCHRAGRKVDFQVLRTFISESGLSPRDWGNLVALPLQGGKPVNWTIASLSKRVDQEKSSRQGLIVAANLRRRERKWHPSGSDEK